MYKNVYIFGSAWHGGGASIDPTKNTAYPDSHSPVALHSAVGKSENEICSARG